MIEGEMRKKRMAKIWLVRERKRRTEERKKNS